MYHHFHEHFYSLKDISEIFSNFLIGIGAIGGVAAGIKTLFDWMDERKKRSEERATREKIIRYREIYPPEQLGIGYNVADSDARRGKIYIIDLRNKTKHWIQSSSTFIDLGFDWGKVTHMTQDEFNSYVEKEPILTSGKPWS